MSNSSLVSYTKISPNRSSRNGERITDIIPHHQAGNLSLQTLGNVFANPGRQASSTYGIDVYGGVGLYVDESERPWTTSNAVADRRAVTIEVANSSTSGDWPVSDASWNTLVELCVDICRRNGIPKLVWTGGKDGNLKTHDMYAATNCPGPYLKSRMPQLADEVNKRLGVVGGASAPQQNAGAATAKKSNEEIAREVINGSWGNGGDRTSRLQAAGYDANAVQSIVNKMLAGTYKGGASTAPARKSNDQIADEVINGKWGNGTDRSNRLRAAGYDPNVIQNLVNQKLGVKTAASGGKSVEQLAREVWAGKWGSGQDRVNRLRAAGYDPTAVQKAVNRMYG